MPVAVSWYIEKHVILCRMYGRVSEEDLVMQDIAIEKHVKAGESPLYLFIDQRDVQQLPGSFGHIIKNMSRHRALAASLAYTILLSNNSPLKFVSGVVARILNVPIRVFNSREDVDNFIERQINEVSSLDDNT